MKTRTYGIHKAKKCVWYHVLNNMFQYVRKHNCMFDMCVCVFFFFLKVDKWAPWLDLKKEVLCVV